MDLLYQLMVGYQGTNHLMCLFTPLTGGTLLSAHAKVEAPTKLTDSWMLIFNLHKGLDAGTHLLNFVLVPYAGWLIYRVGWRRPAVQRVGQVNR